MNRKDSAARQGDGKGTPGKTDAAVAPKSTWAKVRENVEAIFVAIILALIIRHFSLEAFEIPTGSMAPGLHGVHVEGTCPNCETIAAIGIETDPQSGKVVSRLFQSGWFYRGPCSRCGAPVADYLPRVGYDQEVPPGHLVACPACGDDGTRPPGLAEHYHRSRAFGRLQVDCPECRTSYPVIFEPGDCLAGHKILVNKFLYQAREPRRWEVIVFKFNRQRNYIKRLVGLPGETIQVIDGDIWIDGQLERKPLWVQDQLWHPVHDSAVKERRAERDPAWTSSGKGRVPDDGSGAIEFNTLDGTVSELRYRRPIRNYYPYNSSKAALSSSPRLAVVRDLRIETPILVKQGRGSIELEIINGEDVYVCHLPAGEGVTADAYFTMRGPAATGDERLATFSGVRLAPRRSTRVDFFLADRQLVLRLDGEVVGELPLEGDARGRYNTRMTTGVAVRCQGVGARLERLRLYRDNHYTFLQGRAGHGCGAPYAIPGGADAGYFAMGDNSPSSLDSRAWGHVARDNMLGRALAIFWPALPWRWELGFIR